MNARIAKKIIAWPLYQHCLPKKGADGGTFPYTQVQYARARRKHWASLRRGVKDGGPLKWATHRHGKRTRSLVKRLGGDHMVCKPA